MRRSLLLVPLGLLLLIPSGCIGPLAAMIARGPESVARQMGQSAGYNAASGIAGSELGRDAAAASDTMANIDRILKEHPDALNAGEVEALKRELAEDLPPPGGEEQTGSGVMSDSEVTADDSVYPPPPAPASPHDRRREDIAGSARRDQVGTMTDEDIGLPTRAVRTNNHLRVERSTPLDQRWRPTDPHRFTTPRQTSFSEPQPTPTIESLTGEQYAPRDFTRVMLPVVGRH